MVIKCFNTGIARYWLFVLSILCGASFIKASSGNISKEPTLHAYLFPQEAPFYFINSIPAAVQLGGKIDLSFFRNQSLVSQYRYRLELPQGALSVIYTEIITWSPWTNNNLAEIIIPRLDLEGGYKLMIEYMTADLGKTEKFEKPFYVYRTNPITNPEVFTSKTTPSTERITGKTTSITNRTSVEPAKPADKTTAETMPENRKTATKKISAEKPAIKKINIEKVPVNEKQIDIKIIGADFMTGTSPKAGNLSTEDSGEPGITEKGIAIDYEKLLAEAIEKKDTAMFRESIQKGAGKEIKSRDGGNIFHMVSSSLANTELVGILKDRGISINGIDNYGNSPLHIAIMGGEREYVRSLIYQGADLNLKNYLDLSPLHLAVYLNHQAAVKDLLGYGAEINLKGNTGYTALHIASEMNYIKTAKILLLNGAEKGIKTSQGLTPKAISKIQHYDEMTELISIKYSDTLIKAKQASIESVVEIKPDKQNLKISFNLPYDKRLAKKRQFNKVIQIISVPVIALSSAGAVYLKSEADHYYKLSKTAETEEMAKLYYDKTTQYDNNFYITGGVSLLSVYGFIHSTIRKKNVSSKMHKTFY